MTTALLERKELIQQYLREAPGLLSSFSFINIFTWQKFFQFELEVIDGNLCVFARHEAGTFLYLPPLGKNVSSKTNPNLLRTNGKGQPRQRRQPH